MDTYKGSGVSPGIGLGKFYVINNDIDFSIPKKLSFKESQSKLDMRYEQLISELEKENRKNESKVLDAYRVLVVPPSLVIATWKLTLVRVDDLSKIKPKTFSLSFIFRSLFFKFLAISRI